MALSALVYSIVMGLFHVVLRFHNFEICGLNTFKSTITFNALFSYCQVWHMHYIPYFYKFVVSHIVNLYIKKCFIIAM
jgi:hypothetical protein